MASSSAAAASSSAPSLRVLESGGHLFPIRRAARDVGFRVVDGDDWTILWSYRTPWDTPTFKSRARELGSLRGRGSERGSSSEVGRQRRTLFNHLPGTLRLASKAHLPDFMRASGLANATPTSFMLPEQIDELVDTLRVDRLTDASGFPRWVLKSKHHRGVRVLMNETRAGLAASAPAIVQRRVKPLILPGLGRAFDVGIYVLVSSVRPLRVYAYDRALVRICELPFPAAHADFLSRPASFVINHYAPVWTIPFFETALKACDSSAACALRRVIDASGHDGTQLWRRMEAIAARLLAHLRPHVEGGLEKLGLSPRHVFEVFRFDYMVDEHAQPVLTEVNLSPNMVAAHAEDGKVKNALLRDLMRIVGTRAGSSAKSSAAREAAAESAVAGGFHRVDLA